MAWLQSLDVALFRLLNQSLSNPLFDWLMPFLSWNSLFVPALVLGAIALAWKGGARGRRCLLLLVLVVALGDGLVCNSIKKAVARPRPFWDLPDARTLVGKSDSGSMPSSHTANWFAATMVLFLFYRRSGRFLLPVAATIGFSRIYNGVHYPSDVLAGAILGAGYAALVVWVAERCWQWAGAKWFPLWWQALPSLVNPGARVEREAPPSPLSPHPSHLDQHWLRLGYVVIAVLLFARLAYLASGRIELSEDEAYQWRWSKHLALSYYSKPPMIAYTQFLGTLIFGDTEFGIRFFSPVIAAALGVLLLRFFAREVNARAGFCLLLILAATPLTAVGAILMTIDPLSVLFWTAAMFTGWRAAREDSTRLWLWTGLWLGLGFLSKATALFQLVSFAVFFLLWPPARAQLRRPGPWLALGINALCALPVLIWNQQHGWITAQHLVDRAGLEQAWRPSLNFLEDFTLAELGLLNPVFCVAMLWAATACWRHRRSEQVPASNDLPIFLFSMGAPLFLGYWLYTLRARVQPNWIAPAIVPLFCLMVIYWDARWRAGSRAVKTWFIAGLTLGLPLVILLHDTNLTGKLVGRALPADLDPLTRVRGWKETAQAVQTEREKLLAEGKPVFVIGAHYGITGLMAFYLPEAKRSPRETPLVCYQSSETPDNQFFFLPGYAQRHGQSAIYVETMKQNSTLQPPPVRLVQEFTTVTDLGQHDILYRGRVIHTVRLFACRDLR